MFKKIALIVVLVLVVVFLAGFWYLTVFMPNAPAPEDITVELTAERVLRGNYLANHVSVCMDCHAVRDWSFFSAPPFPETLGAGGDKFTREMGLPGNVYAKNLTPTNLSHYTDGELFRVITTGVDRHNEVLFPVMPFGMYAQMAREDVYALIAYIRTLEPKEGNFPQKELDFPVNLLINVMATEYKGPDVAPPPTDKLAYGRYLAQIAACQECHNPGTLSAPDLSRPYAGGLEFDLPGGVTVRSGNLTPDSETGIGSWTEDYFIYRFKMHDPNTQPYQPVEPGQFNSVMPWTMYAGMTDEDLSAIYAYLRTLEPIYNPVVKFNLTGENGAGF
jgi:hypothetical protein